MKVAPGVLCYVRVPASDPVSDQVNGRFVTAVESDLRGGWFIEPPIAVTLNEWARTPSGSLVPPGRCVLRRAMDWALVPVAGPGGPAVDDEAPAPVERINLEDVPLQ